MVSVLAVDGTSKMALPRRGFLQFEVGITKATTFHPFSGQRNVK